MDSIYFDRWMDDLDAAFGKVEETEWRFCLECCETVPTEEYNAAEKMCKKCVEKLEGEWSNS